MELINLHNFTHRSRIFDKYFCFAKLILIGFHIYTLQNMRHCRSTFNSKHLIVGCQGATKGICRSLFEAILNPTLRGGGLLKPPLTKIAFLASFCDPIDPKKFDFSQISMTNPPILFWRLKIA